MAGVSSDSTDKVCNFLLDRKVDATVVEEFRRQKMDELAICHCTEKDLSDLGLHERGHIISLKAYCLSQNDPTSSEEKSLKEFLKESGKERTLGFNENKKRKTLKDVTLSIGWMHYDEKKKRFIPVRLQKGGGTRKLSLPKITTGDEIIEYGKNLFYGGGKSIFGSISQMSLNLGNYRGDVINLEGFYLGEYIQKNRLCKPRLYLLSKQKSWKDIMNSRLEDYLDDYDDDVDFVESLKNNKQTESIISTPKLQLIGSSSDRELLRQEIDEAFQESLNADQRKDKDKQEQEAEENRLIDLMECRKNRVQPEPDLSESHVTVSVRHLHIGNKVRLFKATSLFHCVYDWIGSLSPRPEHFELRDYRGHLLSPDSVVYSGSFNMVETDLPVLLSPSGTISFKGFGTLENIPEETSELNKSYIQVCSSLEKESSPKVIHHEPDEDYGLLQELRESAKEKLNPNELFAEVRREEIYEDMMALYGKRITSSHVLHITFVGEHAYGDGVLRDAYSAYFEAVYTRMEGFASKVPNRFEDEELTILGKIITHAFVLCNIFPLGLCKASLKKILLGDVCKEELLASFMDFIAPREVDIVEQFQKGLLKDAQPIVDILSDYQIFNQLTQENIMSLLQKAATKALVHQPYFYMKTLVEGMGCFWNKVSAEMLESIYSCAIPNADSVIENIITNELCPQDQKVTTWTHRFIRSCSKPQLLKFIRFVTGSTNFPPQTKIKMEFVDQVSTHLMPYAKTCFKILILPRQYASFTELTDNLNFHINHPSSWAVYDI